MTPTPLAGPRVVPANDPAAIALATACLANGGVVAVPTDTVYGIAASLAVPSALRRVFEIKGRSAVKSLPVLVANFEHVAEIANGDSADLLKLARLHWPGPLTVVVPARPDLPAQVGADLVDGEHHRVHGRVALQCPQRIGHEAPNRGEIGRGGCRGLSHRGLGHRRRPEPGRSVVVSRRSFRRHPAGAAGGSIVGRELGRAVGGRYQPVLNTGWRAWALPASMDRLTSESGAQQR